MRRLRLFAFAGLLLTSTPALAWPVDKVLELEVGKEQFLRVGSLDWFEVDDPQLVTVEQLESGEELLLTPKKNGRAYLMTYAEGKPLVWALHVGKPGELKADAAPLKAALAACPKLNHRPEDYEKLVGVVPDLKCRNALLKVLAADQFEAREVALTFEATVLVEQLKEIRAALAAAKSPLAAHYEGATLVLEGRADAAAHRRALWEAFRHSACRIALDDQVEAPDGGG